MDIVIISDFCGSFDGNGNSRFLYLIDLLKVDHSVELITSDFNHGKKEHFNTVPQVDGFNITMLHEPYYPTNVCVKRFIAHHAWGVNVKKYLEKRNKPDVVYCAMPPLTAARYAAKYCEKNNVKFIVDIQDLWPEAYKMVFNVPIISSIVFTPFNWIANAAYKRADEIVAVSQTYVDRALCVNKKLNNGHSVFLGTDLAKFDENVKKAKLIRKNENEIWLGYCGSLGDSYDIKTVLDAMRLYDNSNLKFIIMGNGEKINELKMYSEGLNVLFTGHLRYEDMCGVLNECDMVVNPIKGGSAASIINKHADYAASGKAVLNTQDSVEYRNMIEEYQCGYNIENGSVQDLAESLKVLCENKELRKIMGANSRKLATEKFNRLSTYSTITNTIRGGGID